MKFKDYYETLGVARDATADTLKKAFRKLARTYHPDHAGSTPGAEDKFKEINEAYEVLSDPEKRRRYDELGANWQHGSDFTPPPEWRSRSGGFARAGGPEVHFGGTGFSDFFEQFFGGSARYGQGAGGMDYGDVFGGGGPRMRRGPQRGADLQADLLVTLEEANNGGERSISFRRADPGTGQLRTETLKVRVPAGVREGQRIRLAGKGEPAAGGAAPGDLYLVIRLERHPDFEVDGADLIYDLELMAWEAALGCKKTVPTLKQRVALTIPPGTRSGARFRLKGLGMKTPEGGRGDLYAVVQVNVPAAETVEERELWEKLRDWHSRTK